MNWPLLGNSLLVSLLAAACAVGLGFLSALWVAGLSRVWRRLVLAAAVVALALPPFLVTNAWLHFLGLSGVWKSWLPLDIYSLKGTVWILALMTWPITLLVMLGVWQRLEPSLLESDGLVEGGRLIFRVLLPLSRDGLALASVVTFVLALNNFAVPSLLQVKVLPAELWIRFNTTLDYGAALRMCWPLVLAPLMLLFWMRGRQVNWPAGEGAVPPVVFRRRMGKAWSRTAGVVTLVVLAFSAGLPLFQLAVSDRTWSDLPGVWASAPGPLWHSFWFAAVGAAVCLLIGVVGWRRRMGAIFWLTFLTPGVLLGILLIYLFNRDGLTVIYRSSGIVIIALTLRYLAVGWYGAAHAARGVDTDLREAAELGGASRWQVFRHVLWPQIAGQLAAAWYVIYLLCLWDVETLVLIIPPGGETLALRIFNLLHYGHNTQVDALCALLLMLAVGPLLVWGLSQWLRSKFLGLNN